jgi:formylglycine-generating enzyme required for sulfatase activity
MECHTTLPTEAQWERAARWVSNTLYPWGDEIQPDQANYADTAIQGTSPVGCFEHGSQEGAPLDMIGNVWEWCLDWFKEDYYKSAEYSDPKGPKDGRRRVLRGGSFAFDASYCRSAIRRSDHPSYRYQDFGFRLVLLPGRQTGEKACRREGGRPGR